MLKKRIFIFLKILFYYLIDFLAYLYFAFFIKKTENKNNILIIGHHQLGDFVLSLNSMKEYKKFFQDKNYKITLICNEFFFDLAKKTNYFDEIIPINVHKFFFGNSILKFDIYFKNIIYRFKKLIELKKYRYKKILNPTDLFYISLFVRSLNAEEKIGVFDKNKYLGNFFNFPYTKLIKLDLKHELNDLAEFFRQVCGNKNFLSGLPEFEFEIPKCNFKIDVKNYFVLSLGASFFSKAWSIENYVQSLENFNFDGNVVLVGTKDEINVAEEFLRLYKGKNKVVNLVGETNILEYISIIKNAKFVIGNDSGVIHVAVASKVKSICITSGHGFEYCIPYVLEKELSNKDREYLPISIFSKMECFGCGLICKYKLSKNNKFLCIENINLLEVILALNKIVK
jgi:ADP-heptose:LPS heptosyltransferase